MPEAERGMTHNNAVMDWSDRRTDGRMERKH
jgi:hypothetical protein